MLMKSSVVYITNIIENAISHLDSLSNAVFIVNNSCSWNVLKKIGLKDIKFLHKYHIDTKIFCWILRPLIQRKVICTGDCSSLLPNAELTWPRSGYGLKLRGYTFTKLESEDVKITV